MKGDPPARAGGDRTYGTSQLNTARRRRTNAVEQWIDPEALRITKIAEQSEPGGG